MMINFTNLTIQLYLLIISKYVIKLIMKTIKARFNLVEIWWLLNYNL